MPSSYDISYYFGNSLNVVTPWRPSTPPPPSEPPSLPHYEDSSAVASWALGVEKGKWEEEVWEDEETERDREEAGHQDPRIVSGVSSLPHYSEAVHQHRRPVSDVSSVSSYYSEYRESRALTPIPKVRKWGDAKYEDARWEETNWF